LQARGILLWVRAHPKPGDAAGQQYTVDIVDLSPKFLDFYNAATQAHADPDQSRSYAQLESLSRSEAEQPVVLTVDQMPASATNKSGK